MSHNAEWFLMKDDHREGPFTYMEMISKLQSGEIFEYNYAWAEHLDQWTLLANLPEFSHDRMRNLLISQSPIKGAFKDRKHDRLEVDIPMYAHNGERLFLGKTNTLSQGGASFLINDPLLYPGNHITIHFDTSGFTQKPFRVRAEILRKSFVNRRLNAKSSLQYAVRFLKKQKGSDELIHSLISKLKTQEETNGIHNVHE